MIKIYISIILYIFICKNVKKPKGSEGMHPQVLRNLSDVIARSLPIIFDQSRQLGEVTKDWRKANATPMQMLPLSRRARKRTQGTCPYLSVSPQSLGR